MPTKAAPSSETTTQKVDQSIASSGTDETRGRQLFAEMWPPKGWPMFACVTRASGTVAGTDRNVQGHQSLLKYEVRVTADGIYTIEILHGTLSRGGEVTLVPALGIQFSGREEWPANDGQTGNAVLDVYVGGQRLIPENGLVLRMILAVTFLISRIDRGLSPNLKKTLKLYRLG